MDDHVGDSIRRGKVKKETADEDFKCKPSENKVTNVPYLPIIKFGKLFILRAIFEGKTMEKESGDKTIPNKTGPRNKVCPEAEFVEYAETAMNELLGWYGYGSTKEDTMKTSVNCHSNSNSNSSGPPSPSHGNEGCGWCGKPVEDKNGISAGTLSFCSELCFSQSRRANFKKNKTCDWCRHIRHTVSYVDFQDGASQLQFCSDKCLNQYKMHIFCRETRAHLEMHPHLSNEDNGSGLITPDLWLKNCRSPEGRSPSPSVSPPRDDLPQTSPLPLITVAHPSKLLAPSTLDESNRRKRAPIQRKRKRPSTTVTNLPKPNDLPQDLRIRQSPPVALHEPAPFRTFQDLPRVPPPQNPPKPNPAQTVLPPVTILVPYPILVPVPLPIPIPLPVQSFLDAEKTRTRELNGTSSHQNRQETNANNTALDGGIEKTKENGTETPNFTVDDANAINDEGDHDVPSTNGIPRPLRKRKRVLEAGGKIVAKNPKKPLST